jgi:hypothetical protein
MNLDIPAVRHIFQIDFDMDVKYYFIILSVLNNLSHYEINYPF